MLPTRVLRRLSRLLARDRPQPSAARHPSLQEQEEEAEIARAEEERQRSNDRFAENLVRKAGHMRYPFLDDPFD